MKSIKDRCKKFPLLLVLLKERDEYLIADESKIEQIAINLCANAIKFTSKGSVVMSLRLAQSLTSGDSQLIVSVKDSGYEYMVFSRYSNNYLESGLQKRTSKGYSMHLKKLIRPLKAV